MDMDGKKDYRRPGRGGFSQRRGFYGNTRGFNSRSFGGHTWTFYEADQWESFQTWLKDEKERKKIEETKLILRGVDELMERRLGKRKERKPKKGKKEIETSSSNSDSESEASQEDERHTREEKQKKKEKYKRKGKPKKEWKEKNKLREDEHREREENQLPMREILESLGRIESKIRSVEMKNRSLELEMEEVKNRDRLFMESMKKNEKETIEVDSEAERIQDIFQRADDEQKHNDRWRAIQSEFKGKDGTTKLKEWCNKRNIPYKNKDSTMTAVLATEEEG